MTTAHVHSLTHGDTINSGSAAKSVIAKPAVAIVAIVAMVMRVQRMIMAFSFAGWLIRMQRNYRTRRELAALSPQLLADIGMTEEQRQAELRKPFWNNQRRGQ